MLSIKHVFAVFFFISIFYLVSGDGYCPSVCICYRSNNGEKTANCSSVNFLHHKHINKLYQEIEVLNIQNNHKYKSIELRNDMFKSFNKLKKLNLSNLNISHVPKNVFNNLKKILEINLSFNKISKFNSSVFEHLYTLDKLNLRGNPLQFTHKPFIFSKSVRVLDLGFCQMVGLQNEFFQGVKNLAYLYLDGNYLQTIKEHVLPRNIAYLNLAKNRIVNVPITTLNSLKHLSIINLSSNPINCTCSLLNFQDRISGRGIILDEGITCAYPYGFEGFSLSEINENELCSKEMFIPIPDYKKAYTSKNAYDYDYDFQADDPGNFEKTNYDLNSNLIAKNDTVKELIGESQKDPNDKLTTTTEIKSQTNNSHNEDESNYSSTLQPNKTVDNVQENDKIEKQYENLNSDANETATELNGEKYEDVTDSYNELKEEITKENATENRFYDTVKEPNKEFEDELLIPVTTAKDDNSSDNLTVPTSKPIETTIYVPTPVKESNTENISLSEHESVVANVIESNNILNVSDSKVKNDDLIIDLTDKVENHTENENIVSDHEKLTEKVTEPLNKINELNSGVTNDDLVIAVSNCSEKENIITDHEKCIKKISTPDLNNKSNFQRINDDLIIAVLSKSDNIADTKTILNEENPSKHNSRTSETSLIIPDVEGSGDVGIVDNIDSSSIKIITDDTKDTDLRTNPNMIYNELTPPPPNVPSPEENDTLKENSRQIVDKNNESNGPYIVVVGIILFLIVLIFVSIYKGLCNPKKGRGRKNVIDLEADNGTELLNMKSLLPNSGINDEKHNVKYPNEVSSPETVNLIKEDKEDVDRKDTVPKECHDLNQNDNKNEPVSNGKVFEVSPLPIEKAKAKLTVLHESIPKTPILIQKNPNTIQNGV